VPVPAGGGLQYGGFYLQKSTTIQKFTYKGNGLAAFAKDIFDLGVGYKIEIALAIT